VRPALDYDLWLVGHTTADISDLRHPRALAAALQAAFEVDDLVVEWLPEGAQRARTAAWSSLGEDELAAIYRRGAISLSDAGGRFTGGLEWNKVPRREHESFVRNTGYRQNSLTLYADMPLEAAPRERYLDLARAQSLALDVNYLYAYRHRLDDAQFRTAAGIGAGLRGVYWVNVFGPPFVELIGAERLLSAPAQTERLGPGHVLLVVEREEADAVAAHIGPEFFVPKGEAAPVGSGSSGLLGAIGALRKSRKGFHDEAAQAEKRPEFDFGAILVE
jgi:hypothetical protein